MTGVIGPIEVAIAPSVRVDLFERVLPFWTATVPDGRRRGLHGAVDTHGRVQKGAPRSTVLASRVAWTFATVYRRTKDPAALAVAVRAANELLERHTDDRHGGVWWSIDARRQPLARHKHTYAQSFAVYAFTEMWLATGDHRWRDAARDIITLLLTRASDGRGGFIECATEQWIPERGWCLGLGDPRARVSTNTLLHVVEALANAVRAGLSDLARSPLKEHLELLSAHGVQPDAQGMYQWFADDWRPLGDTEATSPGHDLEAAWLLADAVSELDDASLHAHLEWTGVQLAGNVIRRGLSHEGGVLTSVGGAITDMTLSWWAQAEGIAGLSWAAKNSGDEQFVDAGLRLWALVESRFVSHGVGDWIRALDGFGQPIVGGLAIGPWECPYHVVRTEVGVLERTGLLTPHRLDKGG